MEKIRQIKALEHQGMIGNYKIHSYRFALNPRKSPLVINIYLIDLTIYFAITEEISIISSSDAYTVITQLLN